AHPFGRTHRDLGIGIYLYHLGADERAIEILRTVDVQAARLKRAWMQNMAKTGQALALGRLGRLAEARAILPKDEYFRAGWPFLPDGEAELALTEGRVEDALTRAEAFAESSRGRGRLPTFLLGRELQAR